MKYSEKLQNTSRKNQSMMRFKFNTPTTVYATCIPNTADYVKVRRIFNSFGPVRRMFFKKLERYGYAFVVYATKVDAQNVSCQLITIDGQRIVVKRRNIADSIPSDGRQSKNRKVTENASVTATTADSKTIISELKSPIHVHGTVHDSLASKFDQNKMTKSDNTKETPTFLYTPRENEASPPQEFCVVRVDGIPTKWTAADSFYHLKRSGFGLKAILIYEDVDERSVRQGLIQFHSAAEAEYLVRNEYLKTPRSQFTVFQSSVPSIGRVRDGYCGRITSFSEIEAESEFQKPAPELSPQISLNQMGDSRQFSPGHFHSSENESSGSTNMSNLDSPDSQESLCSVASSLDSKEMDKTDLDPDKGQVKDSMERTLTNTVNCTPTSKSEYQRMASPYASTTYPKVAPSTMKTVRKVYRSRARGGRQNMQAFIPIAFPHRPSRTLVVENFWPSLARDVNMLVASMMPFGVIETADLVPVSSMETRAYITFASPSSAELALCKSGSCYSGTNRLRVRLA